MPGSRHKAQVSVVARHFLHRLTRSIAIISFSAICGASAYAANNPVPFVDIVSPVSITPGSTNVTLTVRGTGFVSTSTVTWNGISLTTTFVSSDELTATVPNGFVAAVGLGSVLVVSPTPGGGKSGVTFVPVAATEATTSFPATPTSSVSVGTMPQGLVTADFNADGKLDLAAANNGDNTVSILLGNGNGTFTTKSTPATGNGANWVAVGDFNEDGKLDLAVANLGSTGTGGVSILLGNGDGTFTLKSSPNTGNGPFALIAGDFNGDGHLDLAVSDQNNATVSILLGVGDGTFTSGGTLAVGSLPQVIVAGDFNEDGKLDLAVSNQNDNTVSVLLGNGNGSFQAQSVVPVGGSGFPIGLIAADFNGDGHLDLAAVNASDAAILLGNGSGSFTLKANPTTGSGDLIAGVAGDYNGDHILDIVLSDQAAGQAFLLPGVGDGTFGTKLTFTTSAGDFGVATADFNGDGGLDLAVANGNGNNVSIFLQQLPVSLNPTSLTFGNQVVTTSSSSQAVTLTNTTGGTLTFTSIGFTGIESGDFSQTNTCGASILNNTSCTIHVTFTPTATGGRAATLTVVDSGSNSPQTLAVSGTGTAAPSITSANSASFTVAVAGSFTVTTTGFPAPALSEMGSLPSGVTFTDNGDGTATLAGTPATGTAGGYPLTITASNGVGSNAMQSFTLTIGGTTLTIAKAFSPTTIVFNATSSLTFTITNPGTGGTETAVAFTDTLPAGVVVTSPNNLSSTCSGTATAVAGSGSVSLSGGSLANLASCTVSLNVTGTSIGVKNNSVQVTSTPGGTSATANASLTVNKSDTTTTVTPSANPAVLGQSVTFTATVTAVAPGSGTPTGTVTFLDNGSPIGFGTLSGGIATFTTTASSLGLGNHPITTSYGGDSNFNGSTGTLTGTPQVINKASTTTALSSSVNPAVLGQSVTFTATVTAVAPGSGTPTGTVTFLDNGSPIGFGTLSGGVATFTTTASSLGLGNHPITTSYGGDSNFNGSTGTLTGTPQVINKANSATAVTSSLNPTVVGQSVTFTATITAVAPCSGTPSGTVTFLDGGISIGTGPLSSGVATLSTSALTLGNHTITTTYGGDGTFNGSAGSLTGNPQVVNKASTATSVASSVNPSVFGQSVTFTATVSVVAPGGGTATGTVTFFDGGTSIGTGPLSSGIATITTSVLNVGNHTITTNYGGDANFSGNAGSLTGNPQVVNKANSATAVTSSANPSLFGQSVTFTATITASAPGSGTPTGTVTFLDNGTPIGTGTLSAGVATLVTSALAVASHPITTSYGGDSNFNSSTGTLTGTPQVINKASTTTALTSSVNPTVYGQSVTFTATITAVAPGSGTPTGTVTFLDNGSPIGFGTLSGGIATFTTSALGLGNHPLTTSYGGDSNFNGSTGTLTGTPQVVNKANTTTALTSSLNPSQIGQSVTFTATVSVVAPGSGTPTGTVTFLDGGTSIGTGTLSGGVATLVTSSLAAGNHTLTTTYPGDANFNTSTGSLTGNPQVVNKGNTSTALTSSLNPSVFGQSVTFTATVSASAPASGTPTGTVTFLDAGASIGTGTLSGGVATLITAALSVGNHTLTTTYAGDSSFSSGGTGALTGNPQVVNKANTALAVVSSANPSVFGQSVTFTATISAVMPGSGMPTGTVTFLDGGTSIGTGTLSAGVATFTTAGLGLGNHTITTTYPGDGNFNGGAGTLTGNPQVINKGGSTITLTSSQNPSAFGQSATFTATVTATLPALGTPTGTVTFLDGVTSIGNGTLSGGVATLMTSALAAGNHTLTVSYGGDTDFGGGVAPLTGNPQVVVAPPSIAKAFSPTTIVVNATTTLTFTITNPVANPVALAGVGFTDTLPTGLTAANSSTSVCGGTLTVTALRGIVLAGAGIPASSQCQFTVTVTGAVAGIYTNTTGSVSSTNGGTGNTAMANVTVASPPVIAKAFGAATIPLNGGTQLTFTITNPNSTLALTGIAFTDSLPAGLVVASTPGLNSTCGGTASAVAGSGAASLSAGTVAAGASCTVSLNVTGTAAGAMNNSVQVTSTEGGAGNTANASITVLTPPAIAKTFGAPNVFVGGSTSLTFTISNSNATVALAGVAFTDALPSGLQISTPNGLSGSCGAGSIVAAAGSTSVTLSGGAVAASGTCQFSVNVTATGSGSQDNTTGTVTSTNGGGGNRAVASVTILVPDLTIANVHAGVFNQGDVGDTYRITVTNSGMAPTVAQVSVVDSLPSDLTATAMSGTGWACTLATLTCTRSDVLNQGASYPLLTLTVNVSDTAAARVTNTVTVSGGGEVNTANDTATDIANVTQVADLTLGKSHSGNFRQGQVGALYTLTAMNVGNGPTVGVVTVTDTLPAGLTATAMSGTGWACNSATVTCTRGDALPPGGAYPAISLTVTVAANAPGSLTNTAAISGGGELNLANDSATDPTTIVPVADLTVTKSHTGNFYQGETGVIYLINVGNAGPGATLGMVNVVDTLPAGLTPTAISGAGWTCDVPSASCFRNDILPIGSSYPPITLTVSVSLAAAASLINSVTVSGGGELNTTNDTATDTTTVTLPPDFSISALPATGAILVGKSASFSITLADLNFPFANAVTLSATGMPPKASFAFMPSSLTPGAASATSTLLIATDGGDPYVAGLPGGGRWAAQAALLPLIGLAIAGLGLRKGNNKKRKPGWVLFGVAFLFCGLAFYGCTGSQRNFQDLGTSPGVYTVTVTGISGAVQHSTTFTLTVNP